MKKKINVILAIVVMFIILSFVFPNYSYAFDGGKLLEPVFQLLVGICDAIIDIFQKVLLGTDGDALINVDRSADLIAEVLGFLAAAVVVIGSVALAVILAAPTAGSSVVALIAIGASAATMSIGAAVITYFGVSIITAQMLPTSFYLPFIVISPENILQNKISLFDVNFFEHVDTSSFEFNAGSIANDLHNLISQWYYTLRTIAIVGFMLILLYFGIRILISSMATDKAKYKKIFGDWLVSFCLLFVIHYIMIFSMQTVNAFTGIVSTLVQKNGVEYFEIQDDKVYDFMNENLESINTEEIENILPDEAPTPIDGGEEYSTLYMKDGKKTVRFPVDNFMNQARLKMQLVDENQNPTYETISWSIIYIMLTIFTIKFVFVYLKRVVYIAFLILVSPMVVLTYSLDKVRDGQAQGFNMWLKEYLYNLAIQPFHLLLYIVFVSSAMSLASNNPIYVLVVLGFMTQAEKILRRMFNFEKASTPGVLSGALGTGLAMTAMQKMFGRGHHNNENYSTSNKDSNENTGNNRIREQNVDETLNSGEEPQTNAENTNDENGESVRQRMLDTFDENYGTDEYDSAEREAMARELNADNNEGIDYTDEEYADLLRDLGYEDDEIDAMIKARNGENIETEDTESAEGIDIQQSANEQPTDSSEARNRAEVVNAISQTRRNKNQRAKFKLGRAMKGAARHYVQTRGKAWSDKVRNTSILKSGAKMALGGAAALTAGTAGVLLGAANGSTDEAIRNAGTAGAVAYKGASSRINPKTDKDLRDSFLQAGYGDDYKKYKQEVQAREIKANLDNRTVLENELGWDRDEINKFFEETMDQYIDEGVKTLDDMIIGEKLKIDGIAATTKQAVGIMYLGQQIGTDTRGLTKKKREEWAETIISKSPTMSRVQTKMKDIQHHYDNEIKKIKEMNLSKVEEQKRISRVQAKRDADKELTELTRQIRTVQTETFNKLDKYSKYKYK